MAEVQSARRAGCEPGDVSDVGIMRRAFGSVPGRGVASPTVAKLLTEFIGTFFLVLTVLLVASSGSPTAVIAIGLILMAMTYMGGHVSGGHYNPAVTLAVAVAGRLSGRDFIGYVVSQTLAAVAAAFAAFACVGKPSAPSLGPGVHVGPALVVEFLFTFAIALVYLNVMCSARAAGKGFHGLAVGGSVVAATYAGGAISGGAFNPAVGLCPSLVQSLLGSGNLSNVWIYLVGPLLGAMGAAFAFKLQEDVQDDESED